MFLFADRAPFPIGSVRLHPEARDPVFFHHFVVSDLLALVGLARLEYPLFGQAKLYSA